MLLTGEYCTWFVPPNRDQETPSNTNIFSPVFTVSHGHLHDNTEVFGVHFKVPYLCEVQELYTVLFFDFCTQNLGTSVGPFQMLLFSI